ADAPVPDDPGRVDEEAGRHDAEAEIAAEAAGAIDQHGEVDPSFLDHGTDPLGAHGVLRHSDHAERALSLLPAPLPHGQLLTARSPRGEAEQDRRCTEETRPPPRPARDVWEDEVDERISRPDGHSMGISLNASSTLTPCRLRTAHMIQ